MLKLQSFCLFFFKPSSDENFKLGKTLLLSLNVKPFIVLRENPQWQAKIQVRGVVSYAFQLGEIFFFFRS